MQLPSLDSIRNGDEYVEALLKNMRINSGKIQEQLLEQILDKNSNTEYLSRFLDLQENPGELVAAAADDDLKKLFKKKVPLVEYQHTLPYIERIANGEPHHLLSAEPIVELIYSSGTSGGKKKWFPWTAHEQSHSAFFQKVIHNTLRKHITGGGKRMFLYFLAPDITSPGGLVVRSALTSVVRYNPSQGVDASSLNNLSATSPVEVTMCEDVKQSLYCHLLCGLVQKETVVTVGTFFACGFLRVINFLQKHWEELCCNIREGRISDWINDPKCRQAVSLILSEPMPNLADAIEKECRMKSWEGIIKNLWPSARCIEVIITGSMSQYIPKLEFYSGGLPLVSLLYGASEGLLGINLKPLSDPNNVTYCLVPWIAYYEFLPIDRQESGEEEVVDLVNVKIGQQYELVVTTFSGLNRYRVGDILMVTGFDKNAPEFRFVRRRNVILSILSDKTTEEDLSKAISKAIQNVLEPGFILTDYTSYVDLSSSPGHYVLFWEPNIGDPEGGGDGDGDVAVVDGILMEKCCNVVDESLDVTYREWRIKGEIGPLEIRIVKQRSFDELMDFSTTAAASSSSSGGGGTTTLSQYKTPKGISSSEPAIKLLNSMVIASFFSR